MVYSFEELCLTCYPELLSYATKRTKCRARAEDIVQESVVRALQSWDRWEPQGEPTIQARAWMFRIVSNVFANHFKQEKMRMGTEEPDQASTNHPYYNMETIGDEVREALGRINPEWAEIIQMVYIDGIPAEKVAKMLSLAPGTVRSRMARGRLALSRILSPYAKQRWGYTVEAHP